MSVASRPLRDVVRQRDAALPSAPLLGRSVFRMEIAGDRRRAFVGPRGKNAWSRPHSFMYDDARRLAWPACKPKPTVRQPTRPLA